MISIQEQLSSFQSISPFGSVSFVIAAQATPGEKCKNAIKAYEDYINSPHYESGKILNQQGMLIVDQALERGTPLTREENLVLRQNEQYVDQMLKKEKSLLEDIFNNCRNKEGVLTLTDKEILKYSKKKKHIEDAFQFINRFYKDPVAFVKRFHSYAQSGTLGKQAGDAATFAIIASIAAGMGWVFTRAQSLYNGFSFFFKGLNFSSKI